MGRIVTLIDSICLLKRQLLDEGFETSTISRRFKIKASDGKMRFTDCTNTEQLLRIIQSIPSPTRVQMNNYCIIQQKRKYY